MLTSPEVNIHGADSPLPLARPTGPSTPPSSHFVTAPGDSGRPSRSCSGRLPITPRILNMIIGVKFMRTAIYARVSTDKQGRDQTIDSQLDALRRWATAHAHELKEDDVYIDEGYSGRRLDRPATIVSVTPPARAEFEIMRQSTPRTGWPNATPTRSSCWRSSARPPRRRVHRADHSPTTPTTSSCTRSGGDHRVRAGRPRRRFRRGKLQKARAGQSGAGRAPTAIVTSPGAMASPAIS